MRTFSRLPGATRPTEWKTVMENDNGPSSKTELTVERLKRTALGDMDGPEILKLIKEIEDEIRRRGF